MKPNTRDEATGRGPEARRMEMKNAALLTILIGFVFALFSGCATMPQTWPDYERSAENKLVVIQEKIGDGLKTGALTPDQSQMFLTTLKGIRTDYTALRDKEVSRDEWDRIREYLRMTEGGRSTTSEERADISRRLGSLEADLNRLR